jgi:acetoacetyl-CoA reductase
VLVNCAAILRRVDLADLDEATFEQIVDTNLRSVFWLCRNVIPGMQARGFGRIVNVTSFGIHTGGFSLTVAREIPLGRLADPAEVAELIAFLASDRCSYSTGAGFDVNGGLAMA